MRANQKRFLAKSLPYSTIFTNSLPDPLARIRFYLHKDVRAAGIRILSTQRIGAAGIRILSTQTLYIKKIFPLRGLKSLEIL